MSVMIGQASIDERGSISGGKAGDQANELNIRSWYANGWTLVLRFRDREKAHKAVMTCRKIIASRRAGYDQSQRNTLRYGMMAAKWNVDKLIGNYECDCASLMAVCAEAAGVNMEPAYTAGNAPATFQMRAQFGKLGAFEVLTDEKYLTSDKYLLEGDIIVNESRHTCMALGDGKYGEEEMEMVEQSKMIVNGKEVPVERILKNGTNYVKIRDVAAALDLEVGFKGSIATLTSK